jgi:hypothetical protein
MFNIGRGYRESISEPVPLLAGESWMRVGARYMPERPEHVRHSLADVSAARGGSELSPPKEFTRTFADEVECATAEVRAR